MAGDEFERRYLGGGEAIYREKRVSRRTFGLIGGIAGLMGLLALASLAAFVLGGEAQGLGGALLTGTLAVFIGLLAVGTSVARVVVTPHNVQFMIGLRRVVVPLDAIAHTSLGVMAPVTLRADVARDHAEIASSFDGRDAYVRVAWQDPATRQDRVVWIGSDTPELLRDAIDRARGGARTLARVASTEAPAVTEVTIGADEPDEASSGRAPGRAPLSRAAQIPDFSQVYFTEGSGMAAEQVVTQASKMGRTGGLRARLMRSTMSWGGRPWTALMAASTAGS